MLGELSLSVLSESTTKVAEVGRAVSAELYMMVILLITTLLSSLSEVEIADKKKRRVREKGIGKK